MLGEDVSKKERENFLWNTLGLEEESLELEVLVKESTRQVRMKMKR